MENEVIKIPAEKFTFAHADKKPGDKKLETKPVSYMRDAWRRFAKNKASIAGMVIIVIIVLFSLFAPLISRYEVSYTNSYFVNLSPKLFSAGSGFWDGTKKDSKGAATYYKYLAMGAESGRNAVVKTFSEDEETGLFNFRLDTYNQVGYEFFILNESEYRALQEYQDREGIQVIYPIPITSQGNDRVMFDVNDADYWYKTYLTGSRRGEPVLDGEGNFIPIYRLTGNDGYTSRMRIDGDPGKENAEAEGRYRYAQQVQGGYRVRVCYYDYYVYRNGIEPKFIFGSNGSGQDLFVCVASGTRFSLILAIGIALINLIIGAIYGAVAGFYGGRTDLFMERISDILSGIPFMVTAVLFNMHLAESVGVVGALIFAFMLTGWIGTAGTVRMQFYRYKNQEYVLAARTLGARDRRLITKHIFPNALGTIITGAALSVPSVIFSETSLSYLGVINLDDPTKGITSLGSLLTSGQSALATFPHLILFPALIISLLMISFNLFGNGLRDAFNPSLRGSEV